MLRKMWLMSASIIFTTHVFYEPKTSNLLWFCFQFSSRFNYTILRNWTSFPNTGTSFRNKWTSFPNKPQKYGLSEFLSWKCSNLWKREWLKFEAWQFFRTNGQFFETNGHHFRTNCTVGLVLLWQPSVWKTKRSRKFRIDWVLNPKRSVNNTKPNRFKNESVRRNETVIENETIKQLKKALHERYEAIF